MNSKESGKNMWEANYGKEPFDLRLTVLRMMRQWSIIVMCTVVGTLVFSGLYCVKNILMRGEKQYQAESVYRVDYSVSDMDLTKAAINEYTWNTYMHSKEFLNSVRGYLKDTEWSKMSDDELGGTIQGILGSDWRVPSTIVVTGNAAQSTAIARAVEEVMTVDFPNEICEVTAIRVIDWTEEAEEVVPDIRVGRACILGAVLSLFATLVFLLLKETGDDSIWLPATIGHRYGIKVLGTIKSRELIQNVSYLFAGKEKIAICTVQEDTDPVEIADSLKKVCANGGEEQKQFIPVPAPVLCPESAEVLRQAEGILLAVEAGKHAGKQLEYVLEYLTQQDCRITAALLWNADERLIKVYYKFAVSKQ